MRSLFGRHTAEHIESRHRSANALEREIAYRLNSHGIFDCHQDAGG